VKRLINLRQGRSIEPVDQDDFWEDTPNEDTADYRPEESVVISRRQGRRNGKKKSNTIRDVTAALLRRDICQIVGFLAKGVIPVNLDMLFTEVNFRSYKVYLLARGVPLENLNLRFRGLMAAARFHLKTPNRCAWTDSFMRELPNESFVQRRLRNAKKNIPYSSVYRIPELIRKERLALVAELERTKEGSIDHAHLKRLIAALGAREFLLRFMLALPWRSRNLSECRLIENMFEKPCPKYGVMKPTWVVGESSCWQYKFTEAETKAGRTIHCVLPKHLIDPLKEYLVFRKELTGGDDTGKLFVNDLGN